MLPINKPDILVAVVDGFLVLESEMDDCGV
jgi:hypothetical protein